MKSLVTGGAGFIGHHLVEELASASPSDVVVIDKYSRVQAGARAEFSEGVRVYRADILDSTVLRQAMKGVETVFHLAALSSVGVAQDDPALAFQSNVMGTARVLEAARSCGVRRVVITSSREVYGEPDNLPVPESAPLRPKNVYGLTKASAETCCELASGLEVAILRLANVYGPGDFGRVIPIFIHNALLGLPIPIYGGDQILDFVWIRHVVAMLINAARGEVNIGGAVNVGSGVGVTLSSLAARIRDLTGSSSPLQYLPAKPFEVTRFVADTRSAAHLLGQRESGSLAQIGQAVEWYEAQLRRDAAETRWRSS
jgi:UDP-glucose 4-epimerase